MKNIDDVKASAKMTVSVLKKYARRYLYLTF
jgi:hypothetical protein